MKVSVQILSKGGIGHVPLSRNQERLIADQCSGDFDIQWMPSVLERSHAAAGFSETAIILILLAGLAFSTVGKPFLEATAKEAGKDFWTSIKRLIARLRKSQCDNTYRVEGNAYVIAELGVEFIAIEIPLAGLTSREATTDSIEAEIAQYLTTLGQDWHSIEAQIKQFQIGESVSFTRKPFDSETESNIIHVVTRRGGKITLLPTAADQFFRGHWEV